MKIFADKHFAGSQAWFFTLLVNLAIYFRAALSVMHRTLTRIFPAILDTMAFYGIMVMVTKWWEQVYFRDQGYYPPFFFRIIIPSYVLIWLGSLLAFRAYKPPVQISRTVKAILTGSLGILSLYALLPVQYRFSRAIILIGTAGVLLVALTARVFLHLTRIRQYILHTRKSSRYIIIGYHNEALRVKNILTLSGIHPENVLLIAPKDEITDEIFSGSASHLTDIIKLQQVHEVIFCAADISSEKIIKNMTELRESGVNFKIASPGSTSVIGSNSPKHQGDWFMIKIDRTDAAN